MSVRFCCQKNQFEQQCITFVLKFDCFCCRTFKTAKAMPSECGVRPAKPDKELLTRKYGAEVAMKLLSLDADIQLLYRRAVDCVGQDDARIAQLAEPLCQYVTEVDRRQRRRRWQRLMLCSVVAVVLLSCLIACETSSRFICAVTRILWIKVELCVAVYQYSVSLLYVQRKGNII